MKKLGQARWEKSMQCTPSTGDLICQFAPHDAARALANEFVWSAADGIYLTDRSPADGRPRRYDPLQVREAMQRFAEITGGGTKIAAPSSVRCWVMSREAAIRLAARFEVITALAKAISNMKRNGATDEFISQMLLDGCDAWPNWRLPAHY